jgi:ABC-type multidrug transport system fused ATPase/permease subunit
VLRGVSVRLEPGGAGVIGRTGSGKTTLTRLLPRFYDPMPRLGGVDLRDVSLAAVRGRIAGEPGGAPLQREQCGTT